MNSGKSKWFRKDNFIVLILMGVLLFVIALPLETEQKDGAGQGDRQQNNVLTLAGVEASSNGGFGVGDTDEAYARSLEQHLKETLSKIADVGEVEVMITLQASRELVVEKEQPIVRSSTEEVDSQGGSRKVSELDSGENTVYRTDGSLSEPYVVKTLVPEIEGVLVVARGAGNGTVNRTIVEIVQALFGVDAHKVKVVKMSGGK